MEYEIIGQELVKCVLVGDTATGKTRLVCARALNATVSLRQLFRQHVPTVWAIDQYRMYKEVLERSMTTVDSVQVSLRLWDTFGDHEKDRRFAYGRSDVILLCFSIGNRNSLLHCKNVWFPEIRRFCPDTPVVLVGCKNDLRFLCRDPTYLSYCRDRSPFLRPTKEIDLVMPEQARALAKELGVPYYETSVFTYYGVNQVFENAIRCALIARRNQRIWVTNLKHIQQPLLQAPYCPPKKELGGIEVYPGTYGSDIKEMFRSRNYPDLVFLIGESEILAHRFVVGAGSPTLSSAIALESSHRTSRRNSDVSTTSESTTDETECLLAPDRHDKTLNNPEGYVNAVFCSSSELEWRQELDEPEIDYSLYIESVSQRHTSGDFEKLQVVVKLCDNISYEAIRTHLYFIYTGELLPNITCSLEDMKEASQLFRIPQINQFLETWPHRDSKLIAELKNSYRQTLKIAMWNKCLSDYATDVVFHLDDGTISAHRALLMARSEVMKAMFSRDFKERRSQSVSLPGVKAEAFMCLLEYLYTDSISIPVSTDVGMQVLELSDRLCLARLVNYVENLMIEEFSEKQKLNIDIMEDCIRLLEPAQFHNVEQLAQWCMIQLATNYDLVCRKHGKLFKELAPENRQWISQYRWPPVWYVKDFDYYQKALLERYKSENLEKKSRKRNNSGCLCFTGKSRRDDSEDDKKEILEVTDKTVEATP